MIEALSRQALDFLWAGAAGVFLGAFYDLLRSLRRCFQKTTLPADMLFSLVFFLSLLALSLYTGGLRLYQCLGLGLGAALYFLTVSSYLLRLFGLFWGLLRALLRKARQILKKTLGFLKKNTKKLFPSSAKSGTMLLKPFSPKRKSTPKGRAKPRDEKKRRQASHRPTVLGHGMESGPSGRRAGIGNQPPAGPEGSRRKHKAGSVAAKR